jgi:hypothetical protein
MPNKLIVLFSGKKGSGKSSAVNFVLTEFLNKRIGKKRFSLANIKEPSIVDHFNNDAIIPINYPTDALSQIYNTYSAKVYTFHDPVKKFCIDTLGLDFAQCHGTVDDKDSPTHISWEDLFDCVREKYSRPRRGSGGIKPASGFMTATEVMKVVENDMFRQIDQNCWARSLYALIKSEGYDLAIIQSANYPNEVTLGTEIHAKSIRLLRNSSKESDVMDEFPLGEYSLVIDNSNMPQDTLHNKLKPKIHTWFQERKIV